MADDKQFYLTQKAFIDRDGEVLVLFRSKTEFDLPAGRI